MPKDWGKTGLRILEVLAVNKEIAQYDLPEKVGKDQSTVFRQIRRLKATGLVQFLRTRISKKKGKDKHIYGITFDGILEVLVTNINQIDLIARVHKDKWLLFQEWNSFSTDAEVKEFLIRNIRGYALEHSRETQKGRLHKLGIEGPLSDKERADYKNTLHTIKQHQKINATWQILCLDLTFALPPWLENPHAVMVKLWKICWTNQNIRKFFEQQFEYEKLKHKNLLIFEEYARETWKIT